MLAEPDVDRRLDHGGEREGVTEVAERLREVADGIAIPEKKMTIVVESITTPRKSSSQKATEL